MLRHAFPFGIGFGMGGGHGRDLSPGCQEGLGCRRGWAWGGWASSTPMCRRALQQPPDTVLAPLPWRGPMGSVDRGCRCAQPRPPAGMPPASEVGWCSALHHWVRERSRRSNANGVEALSPGWTTHRSRPEACDAARGIQWVEAAGDEATRDLQKSQKIRDDSGEILKLASRDCSGASPAPRHHRCGDWRI